MATGSPSGAGWKSSVFKTQVLLLRSTPLFLNGSALQSHAIKHRAFMSMLLCAPSLHHPRYKRSPQKEPVDPRLSLLRDTFAHEEILLRRELAELAAHFLASDCFPRVQPWIACRDLCDLLSCNHPSGWADGQGHGAFGRKDGCGHWRLAQCNLRKCGGTYHCYVGAPQRATRRRQSVNYRVDHRQRPFGFGAQRIGWRGKI